LLDHNRRCPDTLLIRQDVVRYYTVDELRRVLSNCGLEFSENEYLLVPIFFTPTGLLRILDKIGNMIAPTFIGKILPEMLIDAKKNELTVSPE
jgi:hypothetical protein